MYIYITYEDDFGGCKKSFYDWVTNMMCIVGDRANN